MLKKFVAASVIAAAGVATLAVATPAQADTVSGNNYTKSSKMWKLQPIVIGHRGASGYRPEHTLRSYELAARMGADFIEPDLVSTKDGVLVARHENNIAGTTDVADHPEFADRKTTKNIDGSDVTGWFTEDFTLAELKTLRSVERLPEVRPDNKKFNNLDTIPTFDEILELRSRLSSELGRTIGVYPETKHPTFFQNAGLALEEPLVASLKAHGLNHSTAPVYVQSFEFNNLVKMEKNLGLLAPTVFLIWKNGAPFDLESAGDDRDFAHFATKEGMDTLAAAGIDGVGPEMSLVIGWNDDGTLGKETNLVSLAHDRDMLVHAYTFRNENRFLPADYQRGDDKNAYGSSFWLMQRYLDAGLDGFFTDNPDTGVNARNMWRATNHYRQGK